MAKKRKITPFILFFCCFLLVAFAGYQMYEMALSAKYFSNSEITQVPNHIQKKADSASGQVILQWDPVPNAISYNVYWSKSPGVNKQNSNKIPTVTNPTTIKDLQTGSTYHFVVTAVNESGESAASEEISYTVGQ